MLNIGLAVTGARYPGASRATAKAGACIVSA